MAHPLARVALAVLLGLVPAASWSGVADTIHNLSVGGPGRVRAVSESGVCVFCHIPHRAATQAPLWNRPASTATYQPYGSTTTQAAPGQPTGASILCLSCHDGTIAFGAVLSRLRPFTMVAGMETMPSGPGLVGTDLGDDHPVSFAYTAGLAAGRGDLQEPALLLGPVRLDSTGQVQCTSCHDPHDDTYPPFLVTSNHESALCRACHRPAGWEASAHAGSAAPLSGAAEDRWSHAQAATVGGAACLACHKTHTAQQSERLLLRTWEEDNCLICHDGSVAAANVQADFQKGSRHFLAGSFQVHDPVEPAVVTTRHVECADCHNPHATRAGDGVDGPLARVRGVSASGVALAAASETYQVCLRCHGDSPGQPAPRVNRQVPQTNVRLEFDPANPSFHPVVAATGRNLPSTDLAWAGRQIGCTDCHGSDQGPAAGGAGPTGVHGSANAPLLVLPYNLTDGTVESAAAYSLCYKCHSRDSILADASFPLHTRHVVGQRTPCSVCHDPHGVSVTQGTATHNAWLINFDVGVAAANSAGQLWFNTPGDGTGSCALRCHGVEHAPKSY